MSETLEVGGLTFEVRRSPRRQTLGLTVDRGGALRIHAPENIPEQELARWTRLKLLWVHRALARKEALAPKVRAPEFVSGENFSYLGQNYRLKIVRDAAEPLRLDGNHFWLAEDARSEAEAHFRRWYVRTGRAWLLSLVIAPSPSRVEAAWPIALSNTIIDPPVPRCGTEGWITMVQVTPLFD